MAIERAHVLVGKFQADNLREMASLLWNLAQRIEREGLGEGVSMSGGVQSGYVLQYRVNGDMTHDEYFKQIEAEINRAALSPDAGKTEGETG